MFLLTRILRLIFSKDSSGARHYLLATYGDFWEIYRKRDRKHFYEVIRENTSCKLYFDLEFIRACNSHVQEDVLIESIYKLVEEGLKQILKRKQVSRQLIAWNTNGII